MDKQILYDPGVRPVRFLIANVNSKTADVEIDVIYYLAPDSQLHEFQDFADVYSVTRTCLAVGYDLDLRLTKTLLDSKVHQPGDIVNGVMDFLGLGLEDIHIFA
ncbi:unnamed protein product, partial [marine sediment metagenome]